MTKRGAEALLGSTRKANQNRCKSCVLHRRDARFFTKLSMMLFDLLYDPAKYNKRQRARAFLFLLQKNADLG